MNTQEKLRKEEEALEAKLFSTPDSEKANSETATTEAKEEAKAQNEKPLASEQTVTPGTESEPKAREDWKKRYTNLRASRDEKLFQTQSTLATAQEQLIALQQRVQELESAKPVETKDIFEGIISDDDKEAIGDTALEAMRKTALATAEENRKVLDKELEEMRKLRKEAAEAKVVQTKKDAYDNFLVRLSQAVPDYMAIDTDPEFIAYMGDLDIDGNTRADNFHRAESLGNVATVARFMLDFKATKGTPKRNPLEDKITPEAKATSTPKTTESNSEALTWTQVNAHYEKFSKGGYRGRMAEYEAMEKRIDDAAARGNIRS